MPGRALIAPLLVAAVMLWDPSPSADATNCYHIVTRQRPPVLSASPWTGYDATYMLNYSTSVCGPPFAWTLPPDPPPGWLQYFCIQTKDTSNFYSECADIDFIK